MVFLMPKIHSIDLTYLNNQRRVDIDLIIFFGCAYMSMSDIVKMQQ